MTWSVLFQFLKAHPAIIVVMACVGCSFGGYLVGVNKANGTVQEHSNVSSSDSIREDDLKRFFDQLREQTRTTDTANDKTTTIDETRKDGTHRRVVVVDRTRRQTQVVTKVVTKVVEHTNTVYVDKVVKVDTDKTVTSPLPRYSIGFKTYKTDWKKLKPDDYSAEIGYRFYSELWIKGSYQINSKAPGVGIEWHF